MAHFAEIDENGLVLRVLVTRDDKPNQGHDWLMEQFGGTWVQTSYNTHGGEHTMGGTPLRKNFAGIGYTYDAGRDAFIPPKPFESWVLNDETCWWEPPVPRPSDAATEENPDGVVYTWDEETISWVEVTE